MILRSIEKQLRNEMDTESKNKKIIELCKTMTFSQKIIFSDEGNLLSPSCITNDKQPVIPVKKPLGLWYSLGPSWVSYLTTGRRANWKSKRLNWITHIYRLSLVRSLIYAIEDEPHFDQFTERYATQGLTNIHWDKVQADGWCGVEIRYLSERAKVGWYSTWDCSSGCIWDAAAVRRVSTVAAWKSSWSKV